ncbi:SRPBCC family protein [Halosimplex aquaticum]|uniref:SRPBCC family protein n=1 Tax=Halosimplex aquaticum TaxID=3026162 RepID=A0ABD5Y2I7_9EURY|nr:SRPBCC family protein [Halosimplex aquaticum]
MVDHELTVDLPSGDEQTTATVDVTGPSPVDSEMLRVEYARATVSVDADAETFFEAFSRFVRYDEWAPDVQGSAHWLTIRDGGPGSRFVAYDKPGRTHLAHFGEVVDVDRPTHFAWRAPFSEWQRAFVGTTLDIEPAEGGATVTETLYFDVREEHLPVLGGFLGTDDLDRATFETFLESRLRGLDDLLQSGKLDDDESSFLYTEDRDVAADWVGRISEGEWVRVLYADGEVDFDAPVSDVFNAFSRFARYADWTRDIHVGYEWLDVVEGGVGSKFLIWEKPGDRHVMHYGVVTECERDRRFTWRAPFAEWGKVFLGTSLQLTPRADGGTTAYHVLYVDLPAEYLPVFGGFGTLPGFDIEFETFHIYEEADGFQRLVEDDAFTDEELSYLFDENRRIARDWPMQEGRPWPDAALTLEPDRTISYEELLVELSETFAESVPSPAFSREYRDLKRLWTHTDRGEDE